VFNFGLPAACKVVSQVILVYPLETSFAPLFSEQTIPLNLVLPINPFYNLFFDLPKYIKLAPKFASLSIIVYVSMKLLKNAVVSLEPFPPKD